MKKQWVVIVPASITNRVAALPKPVRERIQKAINSLSEGPYGKSNVKPLKGRPEWRLRVGQWRILFYVDQELIRILIVSVNSRGDAYK